MLPAPATLARTIDSDVMERAHLPMSLANILNVKSEPDVHEPSYDCAFCWNSVREDLLSGKRVMTCVRCPAQNKICEACYLSPLYNKSCGQCKEPLSEHQHHRSSKISGDDVIDVDAISAVPQAVLGHAAPAAASAPKRVRAEEAASHQTPSPSKRSRKETATKAAAPIEDVREKMREDARAVAKSWFGFGAFEPPKVESPADPYELGIRCILIRWRRKFGSRKLWFRH